MVESVSIPPLDTLAPSQIDQLLEARFMQECRDSRPIFVFEGTPKIKFVPNTMLITVVIIPCPPRYRITRVKAALDEILIPVSLDELASNEDPCAVCRMTMKDAVKLPCGHLFHHYCLTPWLQRHTRCVSGTVIV